ncbi:MAG: hypothetical protein OXO52_13465 [Rhodospirillales bacterium]|nr:hypothetical protein [Rhodospirillales bacterium]MDE0381599.1 hypothetical protein [Rhodospirillales bacterium]
MKRSIGRAVMAGVLVAGVAATTVCAPVNGVRAGSEARLGLGGVVPEGLVLALRANGADIIPLGSRGGVNGYFVMPAKGTGYSLYVTEDGHAVAGLLYGPDGMEITGAQLAAARTAADSAHPADAAPPETLVPETLVPQTLVPQTLVPETAAPAMTAHAEPEGAAPPSSSPFLTRLFERSAAAFGFTLGKRGPVVVLLGDPACSFSRSAAARLGRAALDGRMQLRVVPVAILGADAARRASAIAAIADPARAWFEGPDGTPDRVGAERIARNNALLDEWRANAVPLIAWRAPDGVVTHRIGDIDDVDAWLTDTFRVGDTRAGHPQGERRP